MQICMNFELEPLPFMVRSFLESWFVLRSSKRKLIVLLDENALDQIVYKQWISTDRSTLETFCVPPEEFAEIFCEKLDLLCPHSFIAQVA